jgi:hypothetical protein
MALTLAHLSLSAILGVCEVESAQKRFYFLNRDVTIDLT